MVKSLLLTLSLVIVVASQAFPCFNPTDLFAVEVVLNKPGANYDLGLIKASANVSSTEGALVYRSHFNKDAAVVLEEISEADFLRGLSVKIQIPTRDVLIPEISAEVTFEVEGSAVEKIDRDLLKSLGYAVHVYEGREITDGDLRRAAVGLSLGKDGISVDMSEQQMEGMSEVTITVHVLGQETFSDELKAEFRSLLASLGVDNEVLDEFSADPTRLDLQDLAEAVDIRKDEFDFKSAVKVELDWLMTNKIITGIDEGDISEIAMISEAGLAGWNRRIVYEKEKWLSYRESGNPMLLRDGGCGGFDLKNLPENDQTIILPGPSSVSSEGKLAAKWGRIKTAF